MCIIELKMSASQTTVRGPMRMRTQLSRLFTHCLATAANRCSQKGSNFSIQDIFSGEVIVRFFNVMGVIYNGGSETSTINAQS